MTSPKACEAGGWVVERQGESAHARVLRDVAGCPDCGGTGLLRSTVNELGRTYEVAAPCPRQRMLQRAERFNRAHIPAVHANSTFENFRPTRPEVDEARTVARNFCLEWPVVPKGGVRSAGSQPAMAAVGSEPETRPTSGASAADIKFPKGYVLSGPVGTGKTHLLAATLRYLTLERGVHCGYVEISLLYATIRRGFAENRSGGEIIGPLAKLDVLAIDELGKGRGSAFELDTLDELISRRYNSGKVTLFATNYSLQAPEQRQLRGYMSTSDLIESTKESRILCDRVGERIYSRMCETCTFVEFAPETPDMRRMRSDAERRR